MLASLPFMSFPVFEGINLDFGFGKTGANWNLHHGCMLGKNSFGEVELNRQAVRLYGTLHSQDCVGFASLQSPLKAFDLVGMEQLVIRYRTKGQRLSISLESNSDSSHKLFLEQTGGKWKTARYFITQFKKYSQGRLSGGSITAEALASVERIGFSIADQKEGDFDIEVDYLRFH